MQGLTFRELQVARFISTGLSNQAIADRLGISLQTVKNYTQTIYKKLMVKNRVQLSLSLLGLRRSGAKQASRDQKSHGATPIRAPWNA